MVAILQQGWYPYPNGHLSTMATFLSWQLVHTFTLIFINLFTAAIYPQRQQPPKLVPTVKMTSSQWPVNK